MGFIRTTLFIACFALGLVAYVMLGVVWDVPIPNSDMRYCEFVSCVFHPSLLLYYMFPSFIILLVSHPFFDLGIVSDDVGQFCFSSKKSASDVRFFIPVKFETDPVFIMPEGALNRLCYLFLTFLPVVNVLFCIIILIGLFYTAICRLIYVRFVRKNRFLWSSKACRYGIAHAQYYMGHAYAIGEGLSIDYARAYAWLMIYSDNPDSRWSAGEDLIKQFQQKMTKEEYKKAQLFIRNYKSEFEENDGMVFDHSGADQYL